MQADLRFLAVRRFPRRFGANSRIFGGILGPVSPIPRTASTAVDCKVDTFAVVWPIWPPPPTTPLRHCRRPTANWQTRRSKLIETPEMAIS